MMQSMGPWDARSSDWKQLPEPILARDFDEDYGGLVVGAKAADLFLIRALGPVMGLVQMGRGLGIMGGPLIGGLLFDLQGNYLVAFMLAVALVFVAIACMWGARVIGSRGRN